MRIRTLIPCILLYLGHTSAQPLSDRFPPPPGFVRTAVAPGSFAHYLRQLPLRPQGTAVLLHNGKPKGRQDVHAAVVDLSVGSKDLQQCADAVIRLRAEYLFAHGREQDIAFDLTNGFRVPWQRWKHGERVRVDGNKCSWMDGGTVDGSHAQFLRYLDFVFIYAGTLSLHRELRPAGQMALEAGDVFIQGGSPGHAVLVLDVARHPDGRTAFLIGQSYMPAQDFHVLRDPLGKGAWYMLDEGERLWTPEWTFDWSDRRRWP
jgi:hypothetical protein